MGCLNQRPFERPPAPDTNTGMRFARRMIDDCFGYIGVQDMALERDAIVRRLKSSR